MKQSFIFGVLTLVAAVFAGATSAVLVSNSLERYAASLLDDRRYAALAPARSLTPTSLEESLEAVQDTMFKSTVFFVDESVQQATQSPFLPQERFVRGQGMIISADGWVLTTSTQLARYAKGGGEYAGFSLLRDGQIYAVEKVIADTQTHAVALRVAGAQGWTPVELAESNEVLAGGLLFGVGTFGEVYNASLVKRSVQDEDAVVPAEEPLSMWSLSEELATGTPLLTSRARLFGFVESSGHAIPAQALRPFIKHALRGSPITHAALGVFVTDLSQPSSLTHEAKQSYLEGVLVIAPVGSRTATVVNGPADTTGLTEGDVILALDDIRITRTTTLADILALYAPGQEVVLRVARNGEVRDMRVALGTWEELVY